MWENFNFHIAGLSLVARNDTADHRVKDSGGGGAYARRLGVHPAHRSREGREKCPALFLSDFRRVAPCETVVVHTGTMELSFVVSLSATLR